MNARIYLLATASSLAMIGAAAAADMAVKAPAMPVPVANWTGFYIGIDGGGARHNFSLTENDEGGAVSNSASGFVGGGHIGYNWQSKYWLFGLEADAMWASLNRTFTSGNIGLIPSSTTQSGVTWIATGRAREGIALDDTLLYLTGGVALAGVNNGWGDGYNGLPRGACCNIQTSETRVGWVAGVGAEHMFTQSLSIRSEILYYDLGHSDSTTAVPSIGGGAPIVFRVNSTNEVIASRVGLSLKW
jgi:outer membrane immunogenic protein